MDDNPLEADNTLCLVEKNEFQANPLSAENMLIDEYSYWPKKGETLFQTGIKQPVIYFGCKQ